MCPSQGGSLLGKTQCVLSTSPRHRRVRHLGQSDAVEGAGATGFVEQGECILSREEPAGGPRQCVSWAVQLNSLFGGKPVGNHKRGIQEEFKTCLWNYYGIMLPCESWAPGPAFWVAAAGPLAMGCLRLFKIMEISRKLWLGTMANQSRGLRGAAGEARDAGRGVP